MAFNHNDSDEKLDGGIQIVKRPLQHNEHLFGVWPILLSFNTRNRTPNNDVVVDVVRNP